MRAEIRGLQDSSRIAIHRGIVVGFNVIESKNYKSVIKI